MQRQRVILHGDKSLKIRHTESQSSTMVQRALSLEVVEGSADVEKIRSSCHQCRQSVCLSTASLFICFVHR